MKHRWPVGIALLGILSCCLLLAPVTAQDSPSDKRPAESTSEVEASKTGPAVVDDSGDRKKSDKASSGPAMVDVIERPATEPPRNVGRQDVIASLTIFILSVFVGFEVITKVPPTLHTPLMSGSNAISGITLVGALIVASVTIGWFSPFLGFIAVTLATVNAVGGFLVTHRMLAMFKKR